MSLWQTGIIAWIFFGAGFACGCVWKGMFQRDEEPLISEQIDQDQS